MCTDTGSSATQWSTRGCSTSAASGARILLPCDRCEDTRLHDRVSDSDRPARNTGAVQRPGRSRRTGNDGGGRPAGRPHVHVVYPDAGGFVVWEFWRTEDEGRASFDDAFLPLVAEVGLTPGGTSVVPSLVLRTPVNTTRGVGPAISRTCLSRLRWRGVRRIVLGLPRADKGSETQLHTTSRTVVRDLDATALLRRW